MKIQIFYYPSWKHSLICSSLINPIYFRCEKLFFGEFGNLHSNDLTIWKTQPSFYWHSLPFESSVLISGLSSTCPVWFLRGLFLFFGDYNCWKPAFGELLHQYLVGQMHHWKYCWRGSHEYWGQYQRQYQSYRMLNFLSSEIEV